MAQTRPVDAWDAPSGSALDLSLVVACYNEEPILEASVREIVSVLESTRLTYELIFVDDCSNDRTREIIAKLLAQYPDRASRAILHKRNIGRGGTVTDGFRAATGRVIGFIDIDLEVHARYIPSCVLAVLDGADLVIGRRIYKFYLKGTLRHLASRGYNWLMRHLLDIPLSDTESGFKFFRRDAVLPVLDEVQDRQWFWDTEIVVRLFLRGAKVQEVPCLFMRRFEKQSTVKLARDSWEYWKRLWRFRTVVQALRGPGSPGLG